MKPQLIVSAGTYNKERGTLVVRGREVAMCEACRFFLEMIADGHQITGPAVPCNTCAVACSRAADEADEADVDIPASLQELDDAAFLRLAAAVNDESSRRRNK